MKVECAVIGGGPAGLSAAVAAARAGVSVALFDEQPEAGGQLRKQVHKFFGSKTHQAGVRGIDISRELTAEARRLGVGAHLSSVVFGLFPGNVLGVHEAGAVSRIEADRIVLAAGAAENNVAFPGWTLPGVMGAGAAQTMMNLHRVLPGRRVVVVGSGNVGLIVAYQLAQAGAEVAAVLEAAPRVGGWYVHAAKVRRMGIPVETSRTVREAFGNGGVEGVVGVALDAAWKPVPGTGREIRCDTVCVAAGLSPLAELAWIAGCRMDYSRDLGGHVPLHDERLRTSVPGLFVAGDVAGVEEASTAMEEGRLAGIEVARSLSRLPGGKAEEMAQEVLASLSELRGGPFGACRRAAKDAVFSKVRP